ncbi:MAG: pilus assembly protein [Proteobacteria bacterium]|nr:pilus assembly protein [Pseudomonadota bacterium]
MSPAEALRCRRRRGRGDEGIVSVELAILAPLLLLLIYGALTIGGAVYARHALFEAAGTTARLCALQPDVDCRALATQCSLGQLGSVCAELATSCRPVIVEQADRLQLRQLDGSATIAAASVQLGCTFVGSIGGEFLAEHEIRITHFSASALVPYSAAAAPGP